MSAVHAALDQAFRREDDDAPVAARSRRDWIVDSVLFLIAAVLALTNTVTSVRHGPQGAMLVVGAIGAAIACLALWWRRRWPLGVGLAVVAVQLVSPAAGVAGAVTLNSVAAYRRWQPAVLVAAAPVELLLQGAPGHGLSIEVRNPVPALAAGQPEIPGTGAGLLGLAERAALTGGRLEHGLDGHGRFRLHAWLPWPRQGQ